jgi:DNA-directed RNA polymerase specialized sigma subunit
MDVYERSAIIGYYRNGMANELIAHIMGISESYVKQIINDYLKNQKL